MASMIASASATATLARAVPLDRPRRRRHEPVGALDPFMATSAILPSIP